MTGKERIRSAPVLTVTTDPRTMTAAIGAGGFEATTAELVTQSIRRYETRGRDTWINIVIRVPASAVTSS